MHNEKSIFDEPQQQLNLQRPLPNATAVLMLGILSLVICYLGVVLGVIALVLAVKDQKLYNFSPAQYTSASHSNLKAGKICAIIGVILQGLILLVYVAFILFAVTIGKNY
jgi:hypothetical protein